MSRILETLCGRLDLIRHSVPDRQPPWKEWIEHPLDLSPWEVWTLLGLIGHRGRQQFVADTIKYRLGAHQDAIAAMGAMGHPDIPQHGIVPGMPDWEYYFHGRGCCLTNRISGDAIDVDFVDSTADWIECFFYVRYLRSLKEPTFVEERLMRLHPSFETIRLSIVQLLKRGLLEQLEDGRMVRLAFNHASLSELLEGIKPAWRHGATQRALGAAVSDWFMLDTLECEDSADKVKNNKRNCLGKRSDFLVSLFRQQTDQAEALYALHDMESPNLVAILKEVLRGPPSRIVAAAVECIDKWDDASWCDDVQKLTDRIDPNGEIPEPFVWRVCAQFLLRHGRESNVKKQLRGLKSQSLGEGSILALEYFPDIAIETFRRALRSKIPCNRITAAAALAIIDQLWSRRELTAVLSECSDHVKTSECRSALLATHSSEGHQHVLDWEQRNPREPEEGAYLSMAEMALRMSEGTINWEMAKLHERVIKLRGIVPKN